MATTQFRSPTDDILFSLEHVARARRMENWDGELAREILQHFATFAEEVIAPTDAPGNAHGCQIVNGRVRMPEAYHPAWEQFVAQGWQGLAAPEACGGQGMNGALCAGVTEIFAGANQSLQMVTGLVSGAIQTLRAHGTPGQCERYLPLLASGEWLSTMCMTEPSAGSDLSAIRCRAVKGAGGWRLEGEKIFISGGDQDLTEGTLHLVLARTGAQGEGVKGLSLFLCPSLLGKGRRNAVRVTRIEEKMGLHGSPTCQLAFEGAEAELLGPLGGGLATMFTMMNHARLDVALQGVARAARAADIARSYAADRLQGRGITGAGVTIDRHPAVAEMIDEADAIALGARALCHIALVELECGSGPDLVEFLTPLCKVYATDGGIRAADLAIQVLGGYGYLSEYGAEQNYRDARITSIYEGTNQVHALTLATRLLRHKGGAAADAFSGFLASEAALAFAPGLDEVLQLWTGARTRLSTSAAAAASAEAFMQLTIRAALLVAWGRIGAAAGKAPERDRLVRLAAKATARAKAEAPFWCARIGQSDPPRPLHQAARRAAHAQGSA